MWNCKCKTENFVSSSICAACGAPMPQSERNRIYRKQLKYAQKKQLYLLTKPITVFLRQYLKSKGIPTSGVLDALSAILHVIWDLVKRYRKAFISVAAVFAIAAGVRGLTSLENRYVLRYIHKESAIRREAFSEHMTQKLENLPQVIEYFRENPANSLNQEYPERLAEKKKILTENAKKAVAKAVEFVKEIGEEIQK